jgi:hypothetical protein
MQVTDEFGAAVQRESALPARRNQTHAGWLPTLVNEI